MASNVHRNEAETPKRKVGKLGFDSTVDGKGKIPNLDDETPLTLELCKCQTLESFPQNH